MDTEERRRRLAVRHRLAPAARVDDAAEVARSVVALHATDPTSVYLQVQARSGLAAEAVELALFGDRTVVKLMGMRRTLFAAPVDTVAVIQHATMDRVGAEQRRVLIKDLTVTETVGGDVASWLDEVCDATVDALHALGGAATPAELVAAEPRLSTSMLVAPGKKYEATQAITSRVLTILGCQGRLMRGRAGGGWSSRRVTWVRPEDWLGAPIASLDEEAARAELVRLWLLSFGPAPLADLKWWTGWPLGRVKAALADVDHRELDVDGRSMIVAADDLEPTAAVEPWAALLPALDPTVMGWSDRDWFLGAHGPLLFDRMGNAGPTVWADGHVVGGWGQREDGEIVVEIFDDRGSAAAALVEAERARLQAWMGDRRMIPSFRTPTETRIRLS